MPPTQYPCSPTVKSPAARPHRPRYVRPEGEVQAPVRQRSGKPPVDRLGALALQKLVCPAKRVCAEKTVVSGHGAGMGGLDARNVTQEGGDVARVPAPQDGDERFVPGGQRVDRVFSDLLPALAAM